MQRRDSATEETGRPKSQRDDGVYLIDDVSLVTMTIRTCNAMES